MEKLEHANSLGNLGQYIANEMVKASEWEKQWLLKKWRSARATWGWSDVPKKRRKKKNRKEPQLDVFKDRYDRPIRYHAAADEDRKALIRSAMWRSGEFLLAEVLGEAGKDLTRTKEEVEKKVGGKPSQNSEPKTEDPWKLPASKRSLEELAEEKLVMQAKDLLRE